MPQSKHGQGRKGSGAEAHAPKQSSRNHTRFSRLILRTAVQRRDDLVYIIAALQFGTVLILATIFWADPVIEKLRARPQPRPISRRITLEAPAA